jgi:hypothetical protein
MKRERMAEASRDCSSRFNTHSAFGRPIDKLASVDAAVRPSNPPREVFASEQQQFCCGLRQVDPNDELLRVAVSDKTN